MTLQKARIIFHSHMSALQKRKLTAYEQRQLDTARAVLRRWRGSAMGPRYREAVRGNPAKSTRQSSGKKVARVYGRVLRIEAQKVGPHRNCDAECRRCKHKYFHDFKKGARMFGLKPGQVFKVPAGCWPLLIM